MLINVLSFIGCTSYEKVINLKNTRTDTSRLQMYILCLLFFIITQTYTPAAQPIYAVENNTHKNGPPFRRAISEYHSCSVNYFTSQKILVSLLSFAATAL